MHRKAGGPFEGTTQARWEARIPYRPAATYLIYGTTGTWRAHNVLRQPRELKDTLASAGLRIQRS